MPKLLQIKAWQYFLLFYVIPYAIQISVMLVGPPRMAYAAELALLGGIVMVVMPHLWMLSVVRYLGPKASSYEDLSPDQFYFCFALILATTAFESFGARWLGSVDGKTGISEALSFILPLARLVCVIMNVSYVARVISAALLESRVEWSDTKYRFFKVLFLFVGIWTLQREVEEAGQDSSYKKYSDVLDQF